MLVVVTSKSVQCVQTQAVLAELRVHNAVLDRCSTAVATVPGAAAEVVFIIAIAITLPFQVFAHAYAWAARVRGGGFFSMCWIQTPALCAEFLIHFAAIDRLRTAVAAVPRATCFVVLIIAISVPLPFGFFARLVVRVQAFTLVTEFCVNVGTTAVTTVILARFDVVNVITSPIAFPCLLFAPGHFLYIIGIQALALRAEFRFNVGATAVTTVILAGFDVVLVIAVAISLPVLFHTSRSHVSRIQTLAIGAVFCVNVPATITTVPITATKIVIVVAHAITLPISFRAWLILFRTVRCHC